MSPISHLKHSFSDYGQGKTDSFFEALLLLCLIAADCDPPEPESGDEPQVPAALHQHRRLQQLDGQVQGDQEGRGPNIQTSIRLWQEIRSGYIYPF